MSDNQLSRREILSKGGAAGALAMLATTPALSEESKPTEQPADPLLPPENALGRFMCQDRVVSQCDSPHRELKITSARGPQGADETLRVLSGTVGVFRANTGRDEFTNQGGWYWQCGDQQGKTRFPSENQSLWGPDAGPLVLVVREPDGRTVRWYSLTFDFRC